MLHAEACAGSVELQLDNRAVDLDEFNVVSISHQVGPHRLRGWVLLMSTIGCSSADHRGALENGRSPGHVRAAGARDAAV